MIKFENKANGRFYYLVVQKDLFNDQVLRVIRGGRHHVVSRVVAIGDDKIIQKSIRNIQNVRLKRGYILISH